jgi:hypothetical protein
VEDDLRTLNKKKKKKKKKGKKKKNFKQKMKYIIKGILKINLK